MSTIFIAVPSLEDSELIPTVLDAINKSSGNNAIVLGVAIASSNNKTFKQLKKIQKLYKENIRLSYTKITPKNQIDIFGVGKGRLRAAALYNNEDYFLQIDSHAMFDDRWDEILISLHSEAKETLGLEKVIITAYAGKYYVDDNGNRYLTGEDNIPGTHKKLGFLYNTFHTEPRYDIVPSWIVTKSELVRSMNDKFIPSLKFNANFAFGDKEFANNLGISKNEIFFEEELIQTLELMRQGFSLIYPNIDNATVRHLYADYAHNNEIKQVYKRNNLATEFYKINLGYQQSLAIKNYLSYISNQNNRNVIESYQRYAKVNLFSCKPVGDDPIPTSWGLDIFKSKEYNRSL